MSKDPKPEAYVIWPQLIMKASDGCEHVWCINRYNRREGTYAKRDKADDIIFKNEAGHVILALPLSPGHLELAEKGACPDRHLWSTDLEAIRTYARTLANAVAKALIARSECLLHLELVVGNTQRADGTWVTIDY